MWDLSTWVPHVGPTVGPVGPDNVGPTIGPHYGPTGPTSGSHHMWGPQNQLYVGLTIVFQTKNLWTLIKSTRTLPTSLHIKLYELWWNQFALYEQQIHRKHPKTSAKPNHLMYIGDGLNRLTLLHIVYTTILTRMMTATYKLSRYGRMDDLGT